MTSKDLETFHQSFSAIFLFHNKKSSHEYKQRNLYSLKNGSTYRQPTYLGTCDDIMRKGFSVEDNFITRETKSSE